MSRSPLLLAALALAACGGADDPTTGPHPYCVAPPRTVTLEVYRGPEDGDVALPAHGVRPLAPADEVIDSTCGALASTDGRYQVPITGELVHLRVSCGSVPLRSVTEVIRASSEPGPWRVHCETVLSEEQDVASISYGPDQQCFGQTSLGRWTSGFAVASSGNSGSSRPIGPSLSEGITIHLCDGATPRVERHLRPGAGDWAIAPRAALATDMVEATGLAGASEGRRFTRVTAGGTQVELPFIAGRYFDFPPSMISDDDTLIATSAFGDEGQTSWGRTFDLTAAHTTTPWQQARASWAVNQLDAGVVDADLVLARSRLASSGSLWRANISRAALGHPIVLDEADLPTGVIGVAYYRQLAGEPGALERFLARGAEPMDAGTLLRVAFTSETVRVE